MRRPRILITTDTGESDRRGVRFPITTLKAAYAHAVERAGGLALLVAPSEDESVLTALAELGEGLVITGGAFDIDPALYGESPRGRLDLQKPLRTHFEVELLRRMQAVDRPVLGICGGMQLINVVLGGTLIQDIVHEVPGALEHEQATSPTGPSHPVKLTEISALGPALSHGTIDVNTTHHQAVGRLAPGLIAFGHSHDGIIEAIARPDGWVVGVQWHPELLADRYSDALYRHLIDRARTPRPTAKKPESGD